MNPTNEQELREQVLAISDQVYIPNDTKDYTGVKIGVNFLELERLITAHTNAEIAKAKLEAFDVAFDCHDYDRLRAYRAELLKEVK